MQIDLQELGSVLLRAPQHYLGVTAVPANPPNDPPCSMITPERSVHSFHYALEGAKAFWPNAKDFQIVGSDALIHPVTDAQMERGPTAYPPGFQRLQMPVQLMKFGV